MCTFTVYTAVIVDICTRDPPLARFVYKLFLTIQTTKYHISINTFLLQIQVHRLWLQTLLWSLGNTCFNILKHGIVLQIVNC